jgi:hypothetical protein
MFGWSPSAIATAFDRCINNHNSCSSGDLGDGTRLKMGGGMNPDGSEMACNGCSYPRPDRYVPTRLYGMSKDIKANGTFSIDIRAADDGMWGLMGLGSLNATVTGCYRCRDFVRSERAGDGSQLGNLIADVSGQKA